MAWNASVFEVVDRSAPLPRQQERLLPRRISAKSRRGNLVNHFHITLHEMNRDSSDNTLIDLERVNWGAIPHLLADKAATPEVLDMLFCTVENARFTLATRGLHSLADVRDVSNLMRNPYKGINSLRRFDAVKQLITEAKKVREYADALPGENKIRVKKPKADDVIRLFPTRPADTPQETREAPVPQVAA